MAIDPPTIEPPPRWALVLVGAANTRNRARKSPQTYSMVDLIAAWEACGGHCAVSGLPFSPGGCRRRQAKRPFAPSLDRIDRHQPYQKSNVRLVVPIANFAMNAWGERPLHQLSSAMHSKHGSPPPSNQHAPSDGNLEEVATIDAVLVEADLGILTFPPRPDLHKPILELLGPGPRSSRHLEKALAEQFRIPERARKAGLANVPGYPAWRNHVAWAWADLGPNSRGKGKIERVDSRAAPCGGSMGIYRLIPNGNCLPREC